MVITSGWPGAGPFLSTERAVTRVAPFNINFRYVEQELIYLMTDANARALVYAGEFAPQVQAIRDRLPNLEVLIQVDDGSGNALLDGAVDYESITGTAAPAGGMPTPNPDDLYILYTGGTTGMPKGVLWRQHDVFISAMGGRPFGASKDMETYDELIAQVREPLEGHVLAFEYFGGVPNRGCATTTSNPRSCGC